MQKSFFTGFNLGMKIQFSPITYTSNTSLKTSPRPTFKAGMPIETIKHYNLGMMQNGFIGKVKAIKANGEEAFLNVFKQATALQEVYSLQDDFGSVIGKIEIKPKKCESYANYGYKEDPSHIFVEELRNFSHPGTPYYIKGLEEYKLIGVRLMQIAQRRSDECGLNGNIELISKDESMPFYEKLGLKKIPFDSFVGYYTNPNKMYLPAEAKEALSKMHGGL